MRVLQKQYYLVGGFGGIVNGKRELGGLK